MTMTSYTDAVMGRPATRPATDFGKNLARARQAAGLTQVQFARLVGLSQQMIDYYERRAKNPTAEFVQKAAQVLGVSVDELLGVKPMARRKPGPQSKLQRKIERVRDLPENKQKLVLDFLDTVLQSELQAAR
ncbi:MAG: helix-turn-helix transcriptional regulator [Kiritimatiellae bacterium]|nr:helix-turn-helix transcriptional regulator [Kiritimatiellia bacterium]